MTVKLLRHENVPINNGSVTNEAVTSTHRTDPKKYLWLLGAIVPLLVPGSLLGVWVTDADAFWWSGPIMAFGVIPILDRLVGPDSDNPPDSALAQLESDLFYRWSTYLYLPNQYSSLALACWLWSGGGWITMSFADKLGLTTTVGIVGGIAINAAHELGHTRIHLEQRLSKIALAQTCYGHFFIEHNRGHHVRVATLEDPASARLRENLYAFLLRSVGGGVRSAWHLESRRLARRGKPRWTPENHILNAWLMSVTLFTALAIWFGVVVLPWLIAQAIIGFCLLETVNYLEHYGLRRQKLRNGRYERVRPSHSWNSNTVISNIFLYRLQRHADHHANPLRRYQALRHVESAPQLPYGYSIMMMLALIPPLWRRIMDPRVLDFYRGDMRLAALKPGRKSKLLLR